MRRKIVCRELENEQIISGCPKTWLLKLQTSWSRWNGHQDVILCPPYVYLEMATDIAEDSVFSVGAQNMNENDTGAYTGEIRDLC